MNTSPLTGRPLSGRPLTGRAVLVWLLGFFGLVVAVNTAFVYYAERSFPGLTDANAYERGLAYNRILDGAAQQRALGWRAVLSVVPESKALVLSLQDAAGKPIDDASVAADLDRPAEANNDRHVSLVLVAPGSYSADNVFTPGNWNVTVRVRRGEAMYVVEQRLLVP